MPEMKLKDLNSMGQAISVLMNAKGVDPFAAFRLRKFLKKAVEELTAMEEARRGLIQEFGTKRGDDEYEIAPGNAEAMAKFTEAFDNILDETVVLPNVTVKIREIAGAMTDMNCPQCRTKLKSGLTAADIMNLDLILDQEDDGAKSNIIKLEK